MISKIRDLLDNLQGRKRKTKFPLGLTKKEYVELRQLVSSPQWPTYLALLDKMCKLQVEGVLVDKGDPTWDRGFISGIRKAGLLPQEIIHKMESESARAAERDRDAGERAADRRALATYGTGFWSGRGRGNGRSE